MNYEEAIAFKTEKGNYIEQQGVKYQVVIAPSLEEDYQRFVYDYGNIPMDDTTAINYSSNNQFRVSALYKEGGFLVSEQLKI